MITFSAIGFVESPYDQPTDPDTLRAAFSRIVLNPDLAPGLQGLEPGQQVMVVFYLHLSRGYELLQHPRGDAARPARGVFSLRSPNRPNPIGVSVVNLVHLQDNVLLVRGLDALNGTPVLDLKPA